jgi:protein gp37
VTAHPQALAEPFPLTLATSGVRRLDERLFHARVPLAFVRDVFTVISATPQHTYQVLTKRAARLRKVAGRLEWPASIG